ncbi:MAG TPA: hypothetical protein VGM25_14615 [Caulobacteraceae bacterium]
MRIFLDFEASSLSKDSYPIEVGWAGEDGGEETHLIRPAPDWTDWDASAEAIHHIGRDQLLAEGEPHEQVARRMLEVLGPHDVYATAPSWDGMWLSKLLRAAGLPRHALRLHEADEAHVGGVVEVLGADPADPFARAEALDLLFEARARLQAAPPAHRALADALQERAVFFEVRREAEALRVRRR